MMNRMALITTLLLTIVLVAFSGCGDDSYVTNLCCPGWPFSSPEDVGEPPNILDVADTITIDDTRLYLSSSISRNFMPPRTSDCTRLRAWIRIVDCDSVAIPDGVEPQCVWVVNGNEVWGSGFSDALMPPMPAYMIVRSADCGPKWEPDTLVDVIVKIRHGGVIHYIRERAVRIQALA